MTATCSTETLHAITSPYAHVVSQHADTTEKSEPSLSGALPKITLALAKSFGALEDIVASMTCDTADRKLDTAVLQQHRLAYAAYYQCTAELLQLKDLEQFIHEA